MYSQMQAMEAAVDTAASRAYRRSFAALAALVLTAALCGCQQTAPLAGADPADPGAKVPATGYRTTTAPYRAMRPAAPAAWTDKNRDAPAAERAQP
jgi:hypothetical protein